MIIVSINGRLGNQMFGFALYYCMQKMGRDVYVDLVCNRASGEEGIISDVKYNAGIFDLNYQVADLDLARAMIEDGKNRDIWKRWKCRLFPSSGRYYEEKRQGVYESHIFKLDDIYLHGYWQSEKYFSSIRDEILELYQFPDLYTDYQKKVLEDIIHRKATSVHIRRGDYMQHPEIYGTTNLAYYENAMRYIQEREEDMHFFLFTDDVEWAKKKFSRSDITIVERTEDLVRSNMDMALMAQCEHNIIANSSFSWWGAWLNSNSKKIVIAPNKWEVNKRMTDIWCSDWIKM